MDNQLIVKNENWEVFSLNEKQQYFNNFIDLVKKLDNSVSTDLWTKWKNNCNQIVIETPNYYYKIYNDEFYNGEFFALIREKLAEIYRNDFNLLWNIKTIINDNRLYQIEQREKLQVCNESIISFDDLMLNWGITLNKLEEKLLLPKITKQIHQKMSNLSKIKLIRDCINKFEDYGITKDGNIVLLDDADWFLALVDFDNNWISHEFTSYKILSPLGERIFVPSEYLDIVENKRVEKIGEEHYKWVITRELDEQIQTVKDLFGENDSFLNDNIKLLSTGKRLDNKSLYYFKKDDRLLQYNKKEV